MASNFKRLVFGMTDKRLAARLLELPLAGRIKVLIAVALGWRELCRKNQ